MKSGTVLGVALVLIVAPVTAGLAGVSAAASQSSPTIVSTSVEHVGGTQPDMENISLNAEFQNQYMLTVSLKQTGDGYAHQLSNVGADHSTEFEITVVVENYNPRNMRGTANGLDWEREYREDGTVKVTIHARPMSQQMMTGSHTFDDWPEGDADRADVAYEEKITLLIRSFEGHAESLQRSINGTIIATDALSVGTPALRRDVQGRKRLVLRVAGPHYTVSGDVNTGRYYAVLAPPLLEKWNVDRPEQLAAWYNGEGTDFTATRLDDGSIRVEMKPHYSTGTVAVGPERIPVLFWARICGIALAVLGVIGAGLRRLR